MRGKRKLILVDESLTQNNLSPIFVEVSASDTMMGGFQEKLKKLNIVYVFETAEDAILAKWVIENI